MKFQLDFAKNFLRFAPFPNQRVYVEVDDEVMSILVEEDYPCSVEAHPRQNETIQLLIVSADTDFPDVNFLLENSLEYRLSISYCANYAADFLGFLNGDVDAIILDLNLLTDKPLREIENVLAVAGTTAVILLYDKGDESVVHEAIKMGVQDSVERSRLNHSNLFDVINNAVLRQAHHYNLAKAYERLQAQLSGQTRELQTTKEQLCCESSARQTLSKQIEKQYTFCDTIHDIVGALIVVLDAEGRIVRFNQACRKLTGYNLKEVVGRAVWEFLLVPEEIGEVRHVFSDLVDKKIPGCHENYWRTKSGETRRIAWANTVFMDEAGELEYVISSGIDVTDQDRVAMALRKSENELRLITDAVPVLIAYIDSNQHIQFINKAYEEEGGFSREQVKGEHIKSILGERGYGQLSCHIQSALSGERTSFELSLHKPDGNTCYISSTFVPDIAEEGEVRGFFSVTSDISKLKEAERLERKRIIDLSHASRLSTMGEMATEIAHELNQPLTAIASYSDACQRMLRSDNAQTDEVTAILHEICGQAEYAGEIIRRLRGFSRKRDTHKTKLAMNEIIRDVLHILQIDSRYQNVQLVTKLADEIPPIWADKIMIEQVVLNLLRNAIEASQSQAHRPGQVIVKTTVADGHVLVTVSDSGPGLTEEQFAHLFEPFYTTKEDGIGIGLNISRSIIDNHGGKIWADRASRLTGADFHFILPVSSESSIAEELCQRQEQSI